MRVKFKRNKRRNWLLTIIYRFSKLIILSPKNRLKLFVNLEWIFNRLSHEESFKFYEEHNHPLRTNTYSYLLNQILTTDRVVDIGCKYGEIAFNVSSKAKEVIGVDYDSLAINIANSRFEKSNLTFICDDAYNYLENENEKYDVLLLSHLIEHLENPKEFIDKYRLFFNRIYIEVPDFDNTYLNHYRKDVQTDLIYSDPDHIYEFDRIELLALIASCGLEVLSAEYRFGVQKIWCKNID
jgi:16S rRNA G966 N2-methylase RsmD